VGGGMVKRESEEGQLWMIYLACTYKNRTMKPTENVLRMGIGRMKENDGGVNVIKTHCKHRCKCHSELHPPLN
jgi:hypothetical protein